MMKKSAFLNKLTICVLTFLLTICGAFVSMVYSKNENVTASAATMEYQDLLGIENRSWGAHEGEYYYGGVTLDPFGYFNTASSVSGCWYVGNNSIIAANNGVDIMEYIYVNGVSARKLNTDNANGAKLTNSCGCWLSNPAASPVYVETTNGSGIIIRILKSFVGDSYTITFKAGFSLIRNDGETIYVSSDIIYNCVGNVPTRVQQSTLTFQNEGGNTIETRRVITGQAIGDLPAVPQKSGYVGFWTIDNKKIDESTVITEDKVVKPVYVLEYMDLLGLEDRTSWASGGHSDILTFGLMDNGAYFKSFTPVNGVNGCWHKSNNAIIQQNNGADIMQYIYVNGESARDLLIENATNQQKTEGTSTWLSNPAAWPIAVETVGDVWIRLDKTRFGDNITITFKEGFSLIRNDGETIYLSEDVIYKYVNGVLSKAQTYTLTFDGVDETKRLENGQAIGELPAIPERYGYESMWVIDGVGITADTVYTYSENKTATIVYCKDITKTINLGDWGVPETESDIRYLFIRDNNAEIKTAYQNSYWNDHEDNKNSNFGVDIMDYILIDGESARSIIIKNQQGQTNYKGTVTFPLTIGGIYVTSTFMPTLPGKLFYLKELAGPLTAECN